jgi:hypothetical protein
MKEKDLAVKKDKPGLSRRQPGTKGGKNPCRCYRATGFSPRLVTAQFTRSPF